MSHLSSKTESPRVEARAFERTPSTGHRPRKRGRDWSNYLYLIPAVVLVAALIYFCVAYTIWLSSYQWNGIGPDREFVGLANFARAFGDPIFWRAIGNIALFLVLIFVQMLIGLLFAVVLHTRALFSGIYKVILFIPVVLAPAVMAPVFREIFSVGGEFNSILGAIGLGSLQHAWLADPATALWVLAAICIWSGTGFCFVLYYAGLTQVDPQIFEAARVDGAGNIRVFFSIILPMVRSTNVTLLVLGTIGTIKIFDVPQIITQGGPANSTQFLATYIYQQGIRNYSAGYGAAMTVILIVLCLAFAIAQLRISRRQGV